MKCPCHDQVWESPTPMWEHVRRHYKRMERLARKRLYEGKIARRQEKAAMKQKEEAMRKRKIALDYREGALWVKETRLMYLEHKLKQRMERFRNRREKMEKEFDERVAAFLMWEEDLQEWERILDDRAFELGLLGPTVTDDSAGEF